MHGYRLGYVCTYRIIPISSTILSRFQPRSAYHQTLICMSPAVIYRTADDHGSAAFPART